MNQRSLWLMLPLCLHAPPVRAEGKLPKIFTGGFARRAMARHNLNSRAGLPAVGFDTEVRDARR